MTHQPHHKKKTVEIFTVHVGNKQNKTKAKQGCQARMMNGGKHFPFTKNCELSTPSGETKHGSLISSSTPNWKKEKKKEWLKKWNFFLSVN